MDGAIPKATNPDPDKRYEAMSEFLADLNTALMRTHALLLKRNPVGFWRGLSIILLIVNLIFIFLISK